MLLKSETVSLLKMAESNYNWANYTLGRHHLLINN